MTRIQHTIDAQLKNDAEAILEKLQIPPAVATRMFYREIAHRGTLPFSMTKVPNKQTQAVIKNAHQDIDVESHSSVDQLMQSLEG